MRNFSDNKRGGNRRQGGFGGNRGGGRGNDRPMMHHATCSDCGRDCEVPFKPTRGKTVYCNNCFKRNDDDGRNDRFDRNDRGGDRGFGRNNRNNFEEKRMYKATCDECDDECEVPFRPSGEKPVLCSDCFNESKGGGFESKRSQAEENKEAFADMNRKLDKIMRMLDQIRQKKVYTVDKEEAEEAMAAVEAELEEVTEEVKPKKKAAVKKPATKKAPAKKAPAKKAAPKKKSAKK